MLESALSFTGTTDPILRRVAGKWGVDPDIVRAMARQDTALNADYVYGWLRTCYEGWADDVYDRTPASGYPKYHAGHMWDCLRFWYSGGWYDSGAIQYSTSVRTAHDGKVWRIAEFAAEK